METISHVTIPLTSKWKLPRYALVGMAIILVSELLLYLDVTIVGLYFTPLVWTGYILFIDGLNLRLHGQSLIVSRRREFIAMLLWSIFCWLIFEAYNLYLQNWEYIGLPENDIFRFIGYGWSFATIFPAVLETAEFLHGLIGKEQHTSWGITNRLIVTWVILGVLCLTVPLIIDRSIASKLFALVWLGFFFILDPYNYKHRGQSVLGNLKRGNPSIVLALVLSGLICGLLWEFWNYWAIAKWVYLIPISFVGPKLFEMPLLGYLGFIPFAFECFAMQEFLVTRIPSLRQP